MTAGDAPVEETAEDLFEEAPCGYLSTRPDGTILRVNRTFESWTGLRREELVERRRFQDLLTPGGRIYHETHCAPLLRMQGEVREIAMQIVRADGTRLPALVNSVMSGADGDGPRRIRTMVFDATDRRSYEEELLHAGRREHEIARILQQSMLAGALPAAPGLDLEVVYRPAVRGLDIGGDWYDAFWLDDERVGLVVGDVVGRGIEAAAVMGQLRSALRALASTGLAPGGLLEALDAYARRHGVGRMTTLVYAQLDVATGEVRYACAGHPPPVIANPGEPPSLAWEGRSLPLDAQVAGERRRDEAAVALAPGGTLLLYTDGLVERRSRPLMAGLDLLLAETIARRDEPTERLVRGVSDALDDRGDADDVCLLAARRSGPPAS